MTAQETVNKIYNLIAEGHTVYITNYLRSHKLNQATVDKFSAIGRPVLKAAGNSIFISSGKKYVCVDWCQITYTK